MPEKTICIPGVFFSKNYTHVRMQLENSCKKSPGIASTSLARAFNQNQPIDEKNFPCEEL
jgi:hypothetical protein